MTLIVDQCVYLSRSISNLNAIQHFGFVLLLLLLVAVVVMVVVVLLLFLRDVIQINVTLHTIKV